MAVGSRPVVSCRISLWAERGRTIARKAGRWRANTSAPTRQQRAPIRSMWGAVRCVATVPATRPPATAWAEGTQFNGRPFPATASAEGAQLNGRPSLPRRRPPRAAAHEIVWWTTCHAPESMARHIHSTALRHPAHSTCAPRHRIGPVPHLFHEHPVWLGQAGLPLARHGRSCHHRAGMLSPVTIYHHHLPVGSVQPLSSEHVAGRHCVR